jgi:hypothetical protein
MVAVRHPTKHITVGRPFSEPIKSRDIIRCTRIYEPEKQFVNEHGQFVVDEQRKSVSRKRKKLYRTSKFSRTHRQRYGSDD